MLIYKNSFFLKLICVTIINIVSIKNTELINFNIFVKFSNWSYKTYVTIEK
jgi:hypothetical protein